jgi:hypothetical protein
MGLYILGKRMYVGGIDSVGTTLPLGIGFLSMFDTFIGKHKYTKIYIAEQKSFSDKYRDLITIVTFMAAIFAIIGVIIQIIK